MKPKSIIIITTVIVVAAAVGFFIYKGGYRKQPSKNFGPGAGHSQFNYFGSGEGEIPRSGDPCGGTGGNGQVINIGSNTFILERKDGSQLTIYLTDHKMIKTASGAGSMSDLKVGERVTLVGGSNSDGSFTADTVVVCAGKKS